MNIIGIDQATTTSKNYSITTLKALASKSLRMALYLKNNSSLRTIYVTITFILKSPITVN
jgi:hypothetical protein